MTLQEALISTVYQSGKQLKKIATALGVSSSELSRMCTLEESNRLRFPLEKLPALIEITGNLSILEWLAERAGVEIRKRKQRSLEQKIEAFEKDFLKKAKLFVKLLEALED